MDIVKVLEEFIPQHDFFIGVDSDGCAFDAMEIKHKKVFIPIAVELWGLQAIEKEYYEVAEFVNLYSNFRGINRFPGLLLTFEYLEERIGVNPSKGKLPNYDLLREFVESGMPMSNSGLRAFSERKNNTFLLELLEWSQQGDELFSKLTKNLAPFKYVKEILQKASGEADTMIVSAASTKGLVEDWGKAGLLQYMTLVAGQEAGSKTEQLAAAAQDKYTKKHILMIGDAPGDLKAAKANGALFFPINPGSEEVSWKKLYQESYGRFMSLEYAGEYEDKLIEEFLGLLPDRKPWR